MVFPPRMIEKPGFTVVGLQRPFIHALSPDANNFKVIGDLWHDFVHRSREISHRAGQESYGIVHARPEAERAHAHELLYIAAVRVSFVADLPPDMISYPIPSGPYAVFIQRGPIKNIATTGQHIYRHWLPNSEYEHAQTCDVELYDHRFKGDAEDSEMEWWVPVRKKSAGARTIPNNCIGSEAGL